jgi:DNA-binding FrmR family transcriptional regulator
MAAHNAPTIAEAPGDLHEPNRQRRKEKKLCARLARIEGQVHGLQKLIEADADCEKIAQQMAAARKALDKSFFSMVGCMIEQGDQSPEKVAEMLTKFA